MPDKRQHAFTLVELLVVIGIIAILISILLPSLSRARAAAINIQCQSNLKQVGQAFAMYMNEFNGWMPSHNLPCMKSTDPVKNQWNNWGVQIMPYLIQREMSQGDLFFDSTAMRCPAINTDLQGVNQVQWSYGYNGYLGDGDPRSGAGMNRTPCKFKGFTQKGSSDLGMVMDHQQRTFYTYDGTTKGQKYFFENIDIAAGQRGRDRVAYRHPNKSVNLLFMDGHVENKLFTDFVTGAADDGTNYSTTYSTILANTYLIFNLK